MRFYFLILSDFEPWWRREHSCHKKAATFSNWLETTRALALKPKDVFEEIGYKDVSDKAVMTLESNCMPSDMLIEKVTIASNVKPENFIVIVASTASIAGLTQVAGRVVEVGIHKLRTLGLKPTSIKYACGFGPLPPKGQDFEVAMARTNDAILYGGTVYCTVESDDEASLQKTVEQAPSKTSNDYGKPPADFPGSHPRLLQNRPQPLRASHADRKQRQNR